MTTKLTLRMDEELIKKATLHVLTPEEFIKILESGE